MYHCILILYFVVEAVFRYEVYEMEIVIWRS